MTHICVSKLTIIGSDNGLSPDRRQAIIWTNAGILLIGPLGTNFSEILIEILTFSFKKMRLKVLSVKRRPFCLDLNVVMDFIATDNIECWTWFIMNCRKCLCMCCKDKTISRSTRMSCIQNGRWNFSNIQANLLISCEITFSLMSMDLTDD